MASFSDRFKQLRKDKDLTQNEFIELMKKRYDINITKYAVKPLALAMGI